MSKIIQLLIFSSIYSTLTYAIDLNSTNEIINKATEATKKLKIELNYVVNDIETNSTNVETNINIIENNTTNIPEKQEFFIEKGNPREGKNIFKYVLKEDCNMTAFKFAEKHSQEEWIEILENNKVKETIFETCPNVANYYQDRWTDDLYQFFYEASNEDEIPEC